jgi:hypothetical protein
MRFMLVKGTLNGPRYVEFLKRLAHRAARPIFLIVDGHHCCPVIDLADRCKSLGLQRIGGLAALCDIFGSRHFPAPWGPRRHNAACSQAEASSPS